MYVGLGSSDVGQDDAVAQGELAPDVLKEDAGGDVEVLAVCQVDVDGDAVAHTHHDAVALVAGSLGVHPVEGGREGESEVDAGALTFVLIHAGRIYVSGLAGHSVGPLGDGRGYHPEAEYQKEDFSFHIIGFKKVRVGRWGSGFCLNARKRAVWPRGRVGCASDNLPG